MDTKWTSNKGSNSDNPNHLPGTGHRHNGPQSTNSAVTEETEKQENPISDRLDSGRGNDNNSNNSPAEHSDSTMSNPVNDKVDTSEKSNDSTEDNTPFDLSYFDGIYKTKEKDDPLDLSYFESPYDKNKLEEYLKSNVESGNQLAYTQEDLNDAGRNLQSALDDFNNNLTTFESSSSGIPYINPLNIGASWSLMNELTSNAYGNLTDPSEIQQKIREMHPTISNSISPSLLGDWQNAVINYNKQKQIQEDMGRNGPTVNRGVSKAEEMDLMNRAASDYSSLSDAEKEMVGKVADAVAANPNVLNQPLNPLEPSNSRNNRAITERNQRLRENVNAVNEARETERREASTSTSEPARTESVPETPTRTETPSVPARTEETSTTESVPETPTADVTPTEVATTSTESETPETETPTEVAMGESESEIPEEIDEEPSEETHSVMDAIEGLDDSRRWWEFGSEDYERTRHQIARISPTAEEEFMDFADLINDIVNGSAGDKVKAVLKLISKAAWDTFNILPKVCVDVAKDIVYRLIKGDYDTSGLTEGEQKQVQRFSHNRRNTDMMNAMLDTMDKPINSSIRGKGRGQATDESDYNEGLIEQTNDVTSDVTKKYIISQPWLFKAIQRW